MVRILIVEDDRNMRRLLKTVLDTAGYQTAEAENGLKALAVLDSLHIDLIIADIMMPNMDGLELTRQLREADAQLPVLLLTARRMPEDKRMGFLAGTDDYMTKPVDAEEMLLRVKALLRRAHIAAEHKLMVGPVSLDLDSLTVGREGESVALPPKEFHLLYKLLSYPGKIFTRLQLMDEIWGMETESADNTVNVHVNRLRSRFGSWPEFEIITVRGLGYKAVRNS